LITSDIQPIQNLRVRQKVGEEKKNEWAVYWIEEGFKGFVVFVSLFHNSCNLHSLETLSETTELLMLLTCLLLKLWKKN
jgi:hypothetical protein